MIHYNCEALQKDIDILVQKIGNKKFDAIIAIARGGMIPAQLLAYKLAIRDVQLVRIESYDNERQRESVSVKALLELKRKSDILIVDDIIDSGKSMAALLEYLQKEHAQCNFFTASLYYKKSALVQPDFTCKEATQWIDFFWEEED